jgi:lipid A 3-O-deacylase
MTKYLEVTMVSLMLWLLPLLALSGAIGSPMGKELRLGILRHDVKTALKHVYERGYDFNGEYLFASPQHKFFRCVGSPRPHVGVSISRSWTSQLYTGLTWHLPFFRCLFCEFSLGGEAHNGNRRQRTRHHKALGSFLLFRESVSLGVQLGGCHSLSIMLDHASNARLARPNPGITNFGVRYGLPF